MRELNISFRAFALFVLMRASKFCCRQSQADKATFVPAAEPQEIWQKKKPPCKLWWNGTYQFYVKTTKNYTARGQTRTDVRLNHLPMPHPLTQRHPHIWLMLCLAFWLSAVLAAPACLAAPSQIVEQAFVLDPSGQMTLEQAQQQPQTAYKGTLRRLLDPSVVWLRLRVAPRADDGAATAAVGAMNERLRLVPAWSQSLTLYDPLQRDVSGRVSRQEMPPAQALFTVHALSIPVGTQARDLWVRLQANGPVNISVRILSVDEAATQRDSDSLLQGTVIGAHAMLVLLGFIAWMADQKGIGHTLLTKQVINLLLAALNANWVVLPVGASALLWPEGTGAYVLEGLRLLNMAVSLWFFIRVLELLQAPRWVLKVQRVPLMLMVLCVLLLVAGQLALVRIIALWLFFAIPLGLLMGVLAPAQEVQRSFGLRRLALRGAERLALGLLLLTTWGTLFSSGFYRAQDIFFFGVWAPIAAVCALGVLILVSWRHIRANRLRQMEQAHRAELNAQALGFERGERQRQQEFMRMLTHELKAPLSTLGMVIGSTAPSASMNHHAKQALASMRQVIDHCAQSADIDDAHTSPQQVACSLETELALRCDAQSNRARIHVAPTESLPPVLADKRMLAVIFNNLLDNAFKYSPQGSPICAAVVRVRHPQGAVQRVSVTNQALAGPLPDASRLFQKYYWGDTVQRMVGSGLGLHLARLLTRRQGGDLQYQADAQGITFTLILPESLAVVVGVDGA